jgi:hypothetical protein
MKCRTSIFLILAVAALTVSAAPAANAGARPCLREAKRDAKDCSATCKEDFQAAKDACLNRDHDCVEICRANRSQCRLDSGFDAAIDACNDLLEARRAQCTGDNRDQCIDKAQVDAFECRDSARELAKPLLKQCRKDFRNCAKACPVPNPPTPSEDPKLCIGNAKTALTACSADCKEAFQVAKDDCRNRDHACVEQCRAERHTCRQPVRDALNSDLGDCAADRQTGVDGCNTQYPPPRDAIATVNFDQCVDGVQVEAFICRDDAHESAHPGFADCQDHFRSCVQTNCPVLQP